MDAAMDDANARGQAILLSAVQATEMASAVMRDYPILQNDNKVTRARSRKTAQLAGRPIPPFAMLRRESTSAQKRRKDNPAHPNPSTNTRARTEYARKGATLAGDPIQPFAVLRRPGRQKGTLSKRTALPCTGLHPAFLPLSKCKWCHVQGHRTDSGHSIKTVHGCIGCGGNGVHVNLCVGCMAPYHAWLGEMKKNEEEKKKNLLNEQLEQLTTELSTYSQNLQHQIEKLNRKVQCIAAFANDEE